MLSARMELLARPTPAKTSQKYVKPPPKEYPYYEHPIVPINNERLDMLSKPNKKTPKYERPTRPSTCVKPAALEAVLTPRIDHLSRPYVSKLEATRDAYKKLLGKPFVDLMTEKISQSYDTIYYHTKKSLEAAKAEKSKKKPPKEKKLWSPESGRTEKLAEPKKMGEPEPPPKRKKKPLSFFKKRLRVLALPNSVYKSASQDSYFKEKKRRLKAAQKYIASERIKKLCMVPDRCEEPEPFFGVKQTALEYQISQRVEELAQPKAKMKAPDMDVREDPFTISPAALKYKATPRIIKLAKPVER